MQSGAATSSNPSGDVSGDVSGNSVGSPFGNPSGNLSGNPAGKPSGKHGTFEDLTLAAQFIVNDGPRPIRILPNASMRNRYIRAIVYDDGVSDVWGEIDGNERPAIVLVVDRQRWLVRHLANPAHIELVAFMEQPNRTPLHEAGTIMQWCTSHTKYVPATKFSGRRTCDECCERKRVQRLRRAKPAIPQSDVFASSDVLAPPTGVAPQNRPASPTNIMFAVAPFLPDRQ